MLEAARRLGAGSLAPWTVILAKHQTHGRGRQGRNWTTAPGDALLATFAAPVPVSPNRSGMMAIAAGLAVANALREWNVIAALKWPNDIYVERRKLGGVLIQTRLGIESIALIGVGINLLSIPAALDNSAIALRDVVPNPPTPRVLAESILRQLQATVEDLRAGRWRSIVDVWTRRALWIGEQVVVQLESEVRGRFVGIDEFGRMVLETATGTLTITTGDVERGPRLSR